MDFQCVGGGAEEPRSVLDAGCSGEDRPLIGAALVSFRGELSVLGSVLAPSIDGFVRRRQQGACKAVPVGSSPPCGDRYATEPPRLSVIMAALFWGVRDDA